jgi:hypothetical protein
LTDSEIKRNRSEVSSKWNKCRIYVGDQLDRCRWMARTQGSAWLLLIGKPSMLPYFLNRFSYFMNLWWCLWSFPPTYILHLFHLEDTSLLFLFISESVKGSFLPRVDSFSLLLCIVSKQCACSRRVRIEGHMNRF